MSSMGLPQKLQGGASQWRVILDFVCWRKARDTANILQGTEQAPMTEGFHGSVRSATVEKAWRGPVTGAHPTAVG